MIVNRRKVSVKTYHGYPWFRFLLIKSYQKVWCQLEKLSSLIIESWWVKTKRLFIFVTLSLLRRQAKSYFMCKFTYIVKTRVKPCWWCDQSFNVLPFRSYQCCHTRYFVQQVALISQKRGLHFPVLRFEHLWI